MKEIVLAGGCFWGVEEYFSRVDGILKTEVGYANGDTENPDYEQVCRGITGYAEAVRLEFDEKLISLSQVLGKFFKIIDPTLLNRQGPDIGHQYRTGIYYIDEDDRGLIDFDINELQKHYERPIVTEVEPLKNFYRAEEYHQDYLKKNPGGYCHIDLSK